jgi:hypothetical protein
MVRAACLFTLRMRLRPGVGAVRARAEREAVMKAIRSFFALLACLGFFLAAGPAVSQGMTPSYQGLWWRSPGGSESGWGVNIIHQADILFATWFTYDADGTGLWLVMPAGMPDNAMDGDPYMGGYGMMMYPSAKSYTGTLYRTTGPAFDSGRFDPSKVTANPVGTANFVFVNADNGAFNFTVNGVSQSKGIERQVFATPMSRCEVGGSRSSAPNYQDLWWASPAGAESGWGLNITHQGDTLFVTWFTYDANGKGLWLVMSNGAKTGPGTYAGTLYRTTGPSYAAAQWDVSKVVANPVGTAALSFANADSGTFTYTMNGVTQSKSIVRQVFAIPVSACAAP